MYEIFQLSQSISNDKHHPDPTQTPNPIPNAFWPEDVPLIKLDQSKGKKENTLELKVQIISFPQNP